jgi:alpha-D-ribose 1-methylphosphonate 5-phosphate C-P lyase
MKGYNFAYLDEQTKRMIRRAVLKAVAIPGHQIPFASREMPLPYGWGTGGIQVTASIIGPDDVLKVIDQGADDTTNAVSIRGFFARTAGVATTTHTSEASVIQTRHRIPEVPLTEDQIIVYQVPMPEPLYRLEPSRAATKRRHALAEYGEMHVKLYEDITRFGRVAVAYDHPVMVNGRYLMSPSPIPAFDNPKLDHMPALQLFGAGREKRIYAVISRTTRSIRAAPMACARCAVRRTPISTKSWSAIRAIKCSPARTAISASRTGRRCDEFSGSARFVHEFRAHQGARSRLARAPAPRDPRDRGRERFGQDHLAEHAGGTAHARFR